MTSAKKNIIFLVDIDGTLLETDTHLSQTIADAFKKYGASFDPKEFFEMKRFPVPNEQGVMEEKHTMLFGATWEEAYYYFKSLHPPHDPGLDSFCAAIIEQASQPSHLVHIRRDVVEMLSSLRATYTQQGTGVALVLVTNGSGKEAEKNRALLEEAGLIVDGLVHADMMLRKKPHPDPYLIGHKMAESFLYQAGYKTDSAHIFILEDSPPGGTAGILAGEALGSHCLYIPTASRPLFLPGLVREMKQQHPSLEDSLSRFEIQQDIVLAGMFMRAIIDGHVPNAQAAKHYSAAP